MSSTKVIFLVFQCGYIFFLFLVWLLWLETSTVVLSRTGESKHPCVALSLSCYAVLLVCNSKESVSYFVGVYCCYMSLSACFLLL
jgi:hypothetical protein